MKAYIVKATSPSDVRGIVIREAASIDHVRMMLEREGYSDIELEDDEMSATLRSLRQDAGRPIERQDYLDEVELKRDSSVKAFLLRLSRRNIWSIALVAALVLAGFVSRNPFLVGFSICIAIWVVWQFRKAAKPVGLYDDLLRARARWDMVRMEVLVERMRETPAAQSNLDIQADLAFHEAAIAAKRGQIDRALSIVGPYNALPFYANGLFEGRVATLHALADNPIGFLSSLESACERSNRGQGQILDLAFAHARMGDSGRARKLLAELTKRDFNSLYAAVFAAAEGILLYRDSRWDEAASCLDESARLQDDFRENPAAWPIRGIIAGFHGLAHWRAGREQLAREVLAPWRVIALANLDVTTRQSIESEIRD